MAFIAKKKTKYSTYYVIIENARIDGQSKVVKQLYLGTAESLMKQLEAGAVREEPRQIDCLEYGSVAVLHKIAEELEIRDIINGEAGKRKQGMTTGDYVLLAALNRAIGATSKTKLAEWVDSTSMHLLMKLDREAISSQHIWNHFDRLDAGAVDRISNAISQKAAVLEHLSMDCLVYDTTNYFNYWDVLTPSDLARMTKSKAGRNSLRHIGLALAVDRDHGLPLFHRLYAANQHDSTIFRDLMDAMFRQISAIASDKKALTFVFDKGNNSEDAIRQIDESRHHFIGTRSPYHHRDLCNIDLDHYIEMEIPGAGYSLPVYETRIELYGQMRRILVTYNIETCHRQEHRLEQNLERAKEELSFFKRKVKSVDGRSTIDSLRREADEILTQHHVLGLLDIDVTEEEGGYRVSARKNFPAIEELKKRFGKQILFTNRESMPAADIVKFYIDRFIVEEAFRLTKSDSWCKWDPAFHWTDSKIRVHALTCMISLLLVKIAHKRAREKGFTHGAERMMELLSGVKTAMVFYPKSPKPARMLCSISDEQKKLLTALNISN